MMKHPVQALYYILEADNNVLPLDVRNRLQNGEGLSNGHAEPKTQVNGHGSELPAAEFGYPKGDRYWASCIQIIDPVIAKAVVKQINLENNEAATAIAAVPFASQDDENFLVVATTKDMIVSPRSWSTAYLYVYRFQDDGKDLEFIHKTEIEAPALSLLAFQGRLLAGVANKLTIYDLGMRQLLRKCQAEVVPNLIVGLQTQGSRIIVSDVQESTFYVVYKQNDNLLIPFCDDTISRWTTCTTMVDYETTAGGDKFGNLWLVRCPTKASEEADEEGAGAHLTNERSYLQGAPNRLDLLCHFYPQDIPTSIQKTQLVAGGRDVIFWTGLQGTLGVLVPFVSREDVDFFQSLESHLRTEDPPLAGRDHLIYRGYYVPVKGVIDGDRE